MKKSIILVDIDGTIATCEKRLHHIQNNPKDWHTFYPDAALYELKNWKTVDVTWRDFLR